MKRILYVKTRKAQVRLVKFLENHLWYKVTHIHEQATGRGYRIQIECEENEHYQALFPDKET